MTISIAENNRQNVMQVVSNYGNRLFSFIRNKVKSDEDAEDILVSTEQCGRYYQH